MTSILQFNHRYGNLLLRSFFHKCWLIGYKVPLSPCKMLINIKESLSLVLQDVLIISLKRGHLPGCTILNFCINLAKLKVFDSFI